MRREGIALIDDFDTLAGGCGTLIDAVRYLVEGLGLPLAEALAMATSTPARLLGLEGRIGSLAPGARADLIHLDDGLTLRGVWVAGAQQVLFEQLRRVSSRRRRTVPASASVSVAAMRFA